jgi:hypothetical protein
MSDDTQLKMRKSATSGDVKSANAMQAASLKQKIDKTEIEEKKIPTFFKDPNRYNS